MDDDDELYKFLKANVEKMLGVIMAEKDKKDSFSVKQGEAISWMDIIDPTKPNKKDVNNAITKLLKAAKKSLKRMKNKNQNKNQYKFNYVITNDVITSISLHWHH